MRRHLRDRVLCALSGLILLGGAAWLTAETFFAVPVTQMAGRFLSNDSIRNRLIVILAVLLLVLFAIGLIALCFRRDKKRKSFVVQRVDGGELSISLKTLDSLVQKCLNRTDDIKVNTTGIENHRDGLVILLRASVPAGVSIPLVTEELQKQIKAYVTACSGVDVKEVRVQVDNMSTAESASRFAVAQPVQALSGPAPAQAEEEPAPKPRKLFHQQEQPAEELPPVSEAPVEETEEAAPEIPEETPAEAQPAEEEIPLPPEA